MIQNDPFIRTILSQALNTPVLSLHVEAIGGGSINETYRLTVNGTLKLFCKLNSSQQFPDLFIKEKKSLELIASHGILRVPRTLACESMGEKQVLILEWIEPGKRSEKFWMRFGKKLGLLHQISNDHFGWEVDNFIGALPQYNKLSDTWVEFFISQRLEPQIQLASQRNLLTAANIIQFNNLYRYLSQLFPPRAPALVHGDLWNGNFLCDENDEPVLIDPAIYFGDPGMDLGMTTLFGGFDPSFYKAYLSLYPTSTNYREQWSVCQLYPLLVHLNLFGMSYLPPIIQTIKRY